MYPGLFKKKKHQTELTFFQKIAFFDNVFIKSILCFATNCIVDFFSIHRIIKHLLLVLVNKEENIF